MPPTPSKRILFLRPDTYGDLFLFEPVPRIIRHAWPDAEVAVLIRQSYSDAVPLFPAEGVRWLTTTCNPYRQSPGENLAALEDLRETVQAFAPDCVVAACAEQTWLEAAVATFLPDARQVSLGPGLTDPVLRASLDAILLVDWSAIYPEKIPFERDSPEWEKNLALAGALLGTEAPRWWPVARVPETARTEAARVVAEAGLRAGEFVVCAAAGTANVQIKAWPAEHFGGTLAWLERERGVRALLIGHVSERAHLEAVRDAARQGGAEPAIWTGQDGQMPVLAGILEAARFFFGNDTGALHLAAALGKPVVSIFGGGHWPRFRPVASRELTLVQPLPCFGCAWDCYFVDAPCVQTISPASVQQALEGFLQDGTERQAVFEATGLEPGARALIETVTPQWRFLRDDRASRGRQITELTAWFRESEVDRAILRAQLERKPFSKPLLPPSVREHPLWKPHASSKADAAGATDLRSRFASSEAQEATARAEARRLARELALTRRLLRFAHRPPPQPPRPVLVTGAKTTILSRLRAAIGESPVVFRLDACQSDGTNLLISGWAFCQTPGWDADKATVTLLFKRGNSVVANVATLKVERPEVAAHFTGRQLGAGFIGEILCASLLAGVGLELVLRLESVGRICEQSTGDVLWL